MLGDHALFVVVGLAAKIGFRLRPFLYSDELSQIWPYACYCRLRYWRPGCSLVYRPRLGFLGAWFFVILAPSSSVVPVAGQTIAEHRMYLPLAAVIVLALAIGKSPLPKSLHSWAWL